MKKLNLTKIFLVTLISIVWIVSINYLISALVQKNGYEHYWMEAYSVSDALRVSVWTDDDSKESYENIVEKYGNYEGVICIVPQYGVMDMKCEELEEGDRQRNMVAWKCIW